MFTYHKYRKSIDSTIPLDAHGNPVVEDEGTNADPALRSGQYTVLDERQPLTRLSVDVEGRMSSEGAEIHVSSWRLGFSFSTVPKKRDAKVS